MNSFEKALSRKLHVALPDLASITPGIVIDVHVRGRRRGTVRIGDTYEYYDLASLTKIIFTASNAIHYFSGRKSCLKKPVRELLPWWRSGTTPFQLLTHTAGLDWWKPYYKTLKGPLNPEARWDQLKRRLARSRPGRAGKSLYSDLDLWMLGAYLEAGTGESLREMWEGVADRLALGSIFFHPRNQPRYRRERYAPTEKCPWRGKVLQGEVHDENTWALAGIAPHAGLFGTVEATSDWGLKLRAAVLNDSGLFGDPGLVRYFTGRRVPRAIGDWGLGFMKPSRPRSICGRYFSLQSFGHTGFTGTSLWMDPVHDVLVVILSNRVHPTRDNPRFPALRGSLHDWICELL